MGRRGSGGEVLRRVLKVQLGPRDPGIEVPGARDPRNPPTEAQFPRRTGDTGTPHPRLPREPTAPGGTGEYSTTMCPWPWCGVRGSLLLLQLQGWWQPRRQGGTVCVGGPGLCSPRGDPWLWGSTKHN